MMRSWENYTDVPFELPNGTQIKVSEWRKEVDGDTFTIRTGYMRIDNCPRSQIVVLCNGFRMLTDKPPFRNFDDALDAANELVKSGVRPTGEQVRMLTAVPMRRDDLELPEPTPSSPRYARNPHVCKAHGIDSGELHTIVKQEYRKLDPARTSLRQLQSRVSLRAGCRISMPMIQQRLGLAKIHYKEDKKKAVERAKPIIKAAILEILTADPTFGANSCYWELEKTEHKGYRIKLIKELYHEVRKETGTIATRRGRRTK